jgi:glycosyltransferase involved in cell wall biosynthesis
MGKQMNLIWLPGWFPSRVDFLPGDFIERHAKAVSEYAMVTVVYIVKDSALKNGQSEIVKETTGNLTVYRGYYNANNKISAAILFYKLLFSLYKLAEKENGAFDLCHVHVPLKQSLLAIRLKRKINLEYVVTEHNSWYADGGFLHQSLLLRRMVIALYSKAHAVHVVSKTLGGQLQKMIPVVRDYTVIPNVVNTDFFKPAVKENKEPIKFITIMGNLWQKNTDGVIRAFAKLIKGGTYSILYVVGPNNSTLIQLAKELGIENNIIFHGAVPNKMVADLTCASDAMIFFTRYETFGCVMAESLCCGIPVIASKIPVLEENLIQNINALFVEPDNEDDLLQKLILFINQKDRFDNTVIAADAFTKYNYHTVGQQFLDFYQHALTLNKP